MIIACGIVHAPKKQHRCASCFGLTDAASPHVWAFGAADKYDKPYRVCLHLNCCGYDKKLKAMAQTVNQ
jgi:hypothetical protein